MKALAAAPFSQCCIHESASPAVPLEHLDLCLLCACTPQLVVVHVVEGLGPLPGENAMVYMDEASPFITRDARSFADQVCFFGESMT